MPASLFLPKAVQVKTVLPVAYIGSTPYTSLQQAVQDAGDKAVIELAPGSCVGSAACRVCQGADLNRERWRILYRFPQRFLFRQPGIGRIRRTVNAKKYHTGRRRDLERRNVRTTPAKRRGKIPISAGGGSERDFGFGCGAALQNNDNEKAEKPAAGGVMVLEGTLVLTADAAVRDNRAAANAGGVYLDASVLRMEANASVCHNSAVAGSEQSVMSCVGGVQAVADSQILLGGSARIFENAGTGGGVTLSDRAVLTVSDNGSISGNRAVIGTLAGKAVHTGGRRIR